MLYYSRARENGSGGLGRVRQGYAEQSIGSKLIRGTLTVPAIVDIAILFITTIYTTNNYNRLRAYNLR